MWAKIYDFSVCPPCTTVNDHMIMTRTCTHCMQGHGHREIIQKCKFWLSDFEIYNPNDFASVNSYIVRALTQVPVALLSPPLTSDQGVLHVYGLLLPHPLGLLGWGLENIKTPPISLGAGYGSGSARCPWPRYRYAVVLNHG